MGQELFHVEESNSYNYQVLRKWFTLRKPGPMKESTEAETLAKMKNQNKGEDKKNYGKIELSILFRPFDLKENKKNLIPLFDVGNADDDLTLSCYDLHHGLVGGVVSGVGTVGSEMGKFMRLGSSSHKEHSDDHNTDAEAGNPIDLSSKTSPERQRRNSFGRIFSSK